MTISIGQIVCLTSTRPMKRGEVIAFVPAGMPAMRLVPETAKKSHIKVDMDISRFDRMLVRVMGGVNHDIAYYYAPIASTVKQIED